MKRSIVIAVVVSLFVGAGSAIAANRLQPSPQTGNVWFAASREAVSDADLDDNDRNPKIAELL